MDERRARQLPAARERAARLFARCPFGSVLSLHFPLLTSREDFAVESAERVCSTLAVPRIQVSLTNYVISDW